MRAAIAFLALASTCALAGVYLLAGLGWSLLAGAMCSVLFAVLCIRGAAGG